MEGRTVVAVSPLGSSSCYQGNVGSALWEGRQVVDASTFKDFLKNVVQPRIADADTDSTFESDIQGLATTGMATKFIEKLLEAVPEPEGWEVGEALAECALRSDSGREVHWPWNTVRDRRTPRASLPGTDLVGFFCEDDNVFLLFGEVKTSTDKSTPPNVMYGGSGMTWQLEESAKRLDIQRSLLQWLHARCKTELHKGLFEKAVQRYLSSEGVEIVLFGVLIRDTVPNELDLKARITALAGKLDAKTRIDAIAWYLPIPIAEWPGLLKDAP